MGKERGTKRGHHPALEEDTHTLTSHRQPQCGIEGAVTQICIGCKWKAEAGTLNSDWGDQEMASEKRGAQMSLMESKHS